MNNFDAQYQALTTAAGLVDLSDRTQIEFAGVDRTTLLHNLCTNDIHGLKPGEGREVFITDIRGKTIGHGFVWCGADSLVFDTTPGQAEALLAHFDRYIIREDVQLVDRTRQRGEFLLAGPEPDDVLARLGVEPPPAGRLAHCDTDLAGPVSIRRVDMAGPIDYLISGDAETSKRAAAALAEAGATECGDDAFHAARIEHGTPLFGRDITHENLPQEVDRNAEAISFTKGCYLGQETVARLDALGHVNRTLCGVRFLGEQVPEISAELSVDEKVVGRVTSACFSPRLDSPLALCYLRRGHNTPGSRFASEFGDAEVVALPIVA